jgi:hypothetical protein
VGEWEEGELGAAEIHERGFVRGMGCTDCWRFKGCRVMACGCWKCGECSKNSGENCLLCTS